MMFKRWILLFLTILILTGCASKREINELALVMAVGLDKGKDGGVEITVQIARPADARGQTGAPSGNTGDPIWSASAEGKTIFEAIRNLGEFSTRRIFWAHNFIIVINEDLAKDGIQDILDFFTRNPELRMRTWVTVTPDKAKDIVSTMTGLEIIPGEALDKLFRYSSITSSAPKTELLEIQRAYLSQSTEPVIARIKLVDRGVSNKKEGQEGSYKQVKLSGAGVIKDSKLVGTLSAKETKGLLPFIEKVESGVTVLKCPSDDEKTITLETINETFSVKPSYKNKRPAFKVKMDVETNLVEAGCPFSLKKEHEVNELEKELEKELKGNIDDVIKKAQKEYKADFLELGKVFNNKFPAEWKQMKNHWEQEFVDAKITVDVNAEIKSSVLLYNPTKSGK
ncbi:Ger(x)C family spore germination protein [Neobacillus sp. D3-1R]|uniref:Ger(x)C family spore germination protein n=1 Tax=Neobacillus sp. D3-1R TaxID=3445778 RepID=UPI003FA14C7E